MSGKLLNLINLTIIIVNRMLNDSSFNRTQHQFLEAIGNEAYAMLRMLSSLPDVGIERVRRTLDFESRSHLNIIIGFCDALLDEEDGKLTDKQRELLNDLLDRNYELLSHLTALAE
jgi:hypothetical protein